MAIMGQGDAFVTNQSTQRSTRKGIPNLEGIRQPIIVIYALARQAPWDGLKTGLPEEAGFCLVSSAEGMACA